MALKPYKITINGNNYTVKLSERYDGIASVLGLSAVTASTTDAGKLIPANLLVDQLNAIMLRITYKVSATSKKRRSVKVLVPLDKLDTATGALLNKPWGEADQLITSVRVPGSTYLS